MSTSTLPITILNGFLGAGKTAMLKRLLQQQDTLPGCRLAVIINEMSALDIDGDIVADAGLTGDDKIRAVSLVGGSVSSPALLPKLGEALARIAADGTATHVLLETSGSTHPMPLVRYLETLPGVELRGVLSVIDAVALLHDFDGGTALIPRLQDNLATGQRDYVNLMVEQIMFANLILLTKTDRLPDGALQSIAQAIHPINPLADILGTQWGQVPLTRVLDIPAYDHHRVALLARELEEQVREDAREEEAAADITAPGRYGIVSQTLTDQRPFHPQRLWDLYHEFLGDRIHRSKGYFWLASRDEYIFLWNQAAGSVNLEVYGFWRVAALHDTEARLSREELALLEESLRDRSPVFGDRHCELTVIGEPGALEVFMEALRGCLCTDAEVEAWQAGAEFEDPWPTTTTRVQL